MNSVYDHFCVRYKSRSKLYFYSYFQSKLYTILINVFALNKAIPNMYCLLPGAWIAKLNSIHNCLIRLSYFLPLFSGTFIHEIQSIHGKRGKMAVALPTEVSIYFMNSFICIKLYFDCHKIGTFVIDTILWQLWGVAVVDSIKGDKNRPFCQNIWMYYVQVNK